MALPVTVYRWDDPGAPQLTSGKPSDYFGVLDKCLVTGYGNKLPLGWTTAFTSASARIYRNPVTDGGVGGCLKVERIGADVVYGNIRLTGCANATSMTALTNKGFYFQIYTDIDVQKWVVVGTKLGFYFLTGRDVVEFGTYYCPSFFAGQFEPTYSNDTHCFIATTFSNTSDIDYGNWTFSMGYGLFTANSQIQKIYETLSGAKSTLHKIKHPFMPSNFSGQVSPVAVNAVFSKIPIVTNVDYQSSDDGVAPDVDSSGLPYQRSIKMPIIRGFVAGMLMRSIAGDSQAAWPATLLIDGVQHLGIAAGASGGQQFFINMETW